MTEQREVRCRQCGEMKRNIGNHWRLSAECDYPSPTTRQRQLIYGLLFSGGNIRENEGSRNSQLATTSTTRPFLDWLNDEFGVLSQSIQSRGTTRELRESLQKYDDRPSTTPSDEVRIYEWRTRNLPFLSRIKKEWYRIDEDGEYSEKQAPTAINPTPEFFRVVYAKRGQVYPLDGGREAVVLTVTDVPAPLEDCIGLFDRFNPRHRHHEQTGVDQLVLHDSVAFFECVGWSSVPGFEEKWPDKSDPISPLNRDAWEECPSCSKDYAKLSTHWGNGDCDYPSISTRVRETVMGVLAVGGGVRSRGDGKTARVVIRSTNRRFLAELADQLGVLAVGPKREEVGADTSPNDLPESWEVTEREAANFKDVYRLLIRSHPEWAAVHTDMNTNTESDELRVSPTKARWMYAHRGALYEKNRYDVGIPAITLTRARCPQSAFIAGFEAFDPEIRDGTSSVQLHIGDEEAFFDYIGRDPVSGCEAKWPAQEIDDPLSTVFTSTSERREVE